TCCCSITAMGRMSTSAEVAVDIAEEDFLAKERAARGRSTKRRANHKRESEALMVGSAWPAVAPPGHRVGSQLQADRVDGKQAERPNSWGVAKSADDFAGFAAGLFV